MRELVVKQVVTTCLELESIVARDPGNVRAGLMLSDAYATSGRYRDAIHQLISVADQPIADPHLLNEVIVALIRSGEAVRARNLLAGLMERGNAPYEVRLQTSINYQLLGDQDRAFEAIQKARETGVRDPRLYFYCAVQNLYHGNVCRARENFEKCIALAPSMGNAFVQLASVGGYSDSLVAQVRDAINHVDIGSDDHAALQFALYKTLEDSSRYSGAWDALLRGNAIMHVRVPYFQEQQAIVFNNMIKTCTRRFLCQAASSVYESPSPIFIIGMPRSGTSVLEQLLGNHSMVEAAGELADFPCAIAYGVDHHARAMLDQVSVRRLADVNWGEVGERYLQQTRWRARGKRFFTDKLPCNWMVAGLIHLALPEARILHVVRGPVDVCFSNWRAYLGNRPTFAYSYAMDTLVFHYKMYRRVMAHWRSMLPCGMLDVEYDRLVRDPEAVMREVTAFCGLRFELATAELSRSASPCATLSAAQVRRPIYTNASDDWTRYAAQLSSMRGALLRTRYK